MEHGRNTGAWQENNARMSNRTERTERTELRVMSLEFLSIILVPLILLSVIGNLLVSVTIFIQPRLRNVSYYPILSLAMADLSCAMVAMPSYMLKKFPFHQRAASIICDTFRFSYFFTEYASVLSLMILSLERFFVIWFPMKWKNYETKLACYFKAALCASWMEAAFVSGIPFYWKNKDEEPCHHKPTKTWSLIVILLQVLIPFAIISISHLFIYTVAKRHQKHIQANAIPAHAWQPITRLSRIQTWRKQRKVTFTFVFVLGFFVLCWGPSTIYYICRLLCQSCNETRFHRVAEPWIKAIVKLLTFANSALNPIIYGWRNGKFREGFSRIVFGKRKRSPAKLESRRKENAEIGYKGENEKKPSQIDEHPKAFFNLVFND